LKTDGYSVIARTTLALRFVRVAKIVSHIGRAVHLVEQRTCAISRIRCVSS
jgi:hypothetical protein